MAAHQLLLASDDVFTNPAGIIALRGARDPLRMMHKERTRAGARAAIYLVPSRARALPPLRLGALGKVPDVRQRMRAARCRPSSRR